MAAFGREFVKSGLFSKEVHHWLPRAFEKRQISDYNYLSGISEEEVRDLQEKAAEFLKRAEAFLQVEGMGQAD